jgi:hypothetical protein
VSSTSTDNSTSSGPHEVFEQDWSTTTADKDTWAARERRRSSIFHKIDAYPSIAPPKVASTISPTSSDFLSTSPSSQTHPERRGSILSLWTHGHDADGHAVLHSDDHGVWVEEVKEAKRLKDLEEEASATKEEAIQRGSILSLWKKGKDENGKDVILSGELDEDEILRQKKNEEEAKARVERVARLRKQMDQLQMELDAEEKAHKDDHGIDIAVGG